MEDTRLPSDWDWVKARHACSIAMFFERLHAGASKNVQTRKALRLELHDQGSIDFVTTGPGLFSVSRTMAPGGPHLAVRFILDGQRIRIEGSGVDVNLEGTLTLTDNGECRLKVGGVDLDEWQVLRRALEQLFFER